MISCKSLSRTEKDGRRPSQRTTASTGGGGRGLASGALVHLLQCLTGAGRRGGVREKAQEGQEATSRADGWCTGAEEDDDEGGCEVQPTETEVLVTSHSFDSILK
jgi:hypothetical protein